MKRYFFLCGSLLALLASSCSDEVMESGGAGTDMPSIQENMGKIVITLPADTRATDGNADENLSHDDLHGTVDVDKGHVLVFSRSKTGTDETYKYERSIDLEFAEKEFENPKFDDNCATGNNTRYTASAQFEPDAEKYYVLYAYAYHSEGVGTFSFTGETEKLLQMDNEELTADKVASVSLTLASAQSKTSEIYGGFLDEYIKMSETNRPYPESGSVPGTSSDDIPIIGDSEQEVLNYGGFISRQTGRFEITIDLADESGEYTQDIANIAKAYMVVEKYSNTMPVGMTPQLIDDGEDKKIHFPNPFEATETDIVEATPQDNKLTFHADVFPFEDSKVFIKIVNKDDSFVKHQIRVVDKWIESNFLGIMVPVVSENKITLPPNHWMSLKASYKQLMKNWNIDFEWGKEEYNVDETLKPSGN